MKYTVQTQKIIMNDTVMGSLIAISADNIDQR
jgi:hypothetical protein